MKTSKPVSTKQTIALAESLQKMGIKVEMEHWDGHKHIDIFIPEDGMYIEIEGLQHFTDPHQIVSDLYRDYYSDKEKHFTFRVTNQLIDTYLEEITDAIYRVVKKENVLGYKKASGGETVG